VAVKLYFWPVHPSGIKSNKNALLLVTVAALGYFVDIYDLVLFNVVKKESLQQIMVGASAETIKSTGMYLFNCQMIGMLIGGILWGMLGDKKGRLSVLFGSILLYSVANIVNAFVVDVDTYAVVRVIAGIGLAGELGAGITLVSETMSKENRGYGTMVIVTFGALGAVVAAIVGAEGQIIGAFLERIFGAPFANWQVAYIVGGGLGVLLLLLRIGTIESGMFKSMIDAKVERGNILMLFNNKDRFLKYLKCILVGLPIWYTIGLLVNNSQEIFAPALDINGKVLNGECVKYTYLGLSAGDLVSGLLSQWLKSRRKVVFLYLGVNLLLVIFFLFFANGITANAFYLLCFLLGAATGYWAIFVTIAAEQFGTNIRSTVANTVPNFVRGSVPLITMLFTALLTINITNTIAAFAVGILCIGLALWATFGIKETFGKELDYAEGVS
jgi:putative MFS transporter